MLLYALRRLISAVPTLLLVVTLAFFMMRFVPGGPFDLEQPLPPQVMANLRAVYRLDEPLVVQYLDYLWRLAQGDLGPSYSSPDFTVAELLGRGLPFSIMIGGTALLLAICGGVLAGIVAALRQNRPGDYAMMAASTVGVTVPNFVVAPILQLVFGLGLAWLPVGGWGDGSARYRILPVIALALPTMAVIARLMRGSLIEVLRADHVRTALAYGLPGRVVIVAHALPAALLPVLSYLGPAAAALLTGSVVIEKIFSIPGVGSYFVNGALNRDYTLVMGTVILIAVFVIVFNLLVDLAYAALNPKIRYD